jgi:hypothetical protein
MTRIDTLDQWQALAGELSKGGYHLFQFQYGAGQPEGFHAWFWASGRPEFELVTFNQDIETAIIKFKTQSKPSAKPEA